MPALRTISTLALITLAGCDGVFGLEGRDAIDTPRDGVVDVPDGPNGPCARDPFDTLSSRWDPYQQQSTAAVEANGILRIALPPNQIETSYAGVTWHDSFDFRGGTMTIQVVDAQGRVPGFEVYFALAQDEVNFYQVLLDEKLHFNRAGETPITDGPTLAFDPIAHRYWRLRDIPAGHQLVFETSPDNVTYALGLVLDTTALPLDAMHAEIGAGTYLSIPSSFTPTFDDFELCLVDP